MRGFSLILALLISAGAAQAEGWTGMAAQGQIEGQVVSADGTATLGTGCSLQEKGDKSGLGIFIEREPVSGRVSFVVDGADPMVFEIASGSLDGNHPGRDALFDAMIAGSRAEMVLEDGQSFSFSLKKSGIYLKPCR